MDEPRFQNWSLHNQAAWPGLVLQLTAWSKRLLRLQPDWHCYISWQIAEDWFFSKEKHKEKWGRNRQVYTSLWNEEWAELFPDILTVDKDFALAFNLTFVWYSTLSSSSPWFDGHVSIMRAHTHTYVQTHYTAHLLHRTGHFSRSGNDSYILCKSGLQPVLTLLKFPFSARAKKQVRQLSIPLS